MKIGTASLLLTLTLTNLAGGPALGAEASNEVEARLLSVEQRLDALEDRLSQIVRLLERATPATREGAAAVIDEAAGEVKELKEEVADLEGSEEAVEQQDSQPADTPGGAAVQINGYMDFHLNHDNVNPTTLDFHRFVLLFGHDFSDRIRFVSEVELEHALVEGGEASGEIELEQAYLNFALHPAFNFRAGMMLTPVGIINLTHEPPSFNGVERPFVDEVIIPTTWFANGAGLLGDLGHGFRYQAMVMSSLNAVEFNAEEGFRGGRQKGFFENARNLAVVGRLEYSGQPGLDLGTSFWIGETGFDLPDTSAQLKIFEFDGRYSYKRFDARGQYAITDLEEAGRINRLLQQRTGVSPNLAEQTRGFYLEGAVHLLPTGNPHDLVAFYRYESFDTQYRMPAGFVPLEQFDRSAHVMGLTYSPYPDIAFKFDYVVLRNASRLLDAPNQWNFGIGWWF